MSGVRGRRADLGHQMLQFGMSSRESGRDGDGGRGRLKRSGERVAPGPAARGAQWGRSRQPAFPFLRIASQDFSGRSAPLAARDGD